MNSTFILLGTNIGDRIENLTTAIGQIRSTCGNVIKKSHVYETEPWGIKEQASFLNAVIRIETTLTPLTLLENLLAIEAQMGRIRSTKWGERIIDLDILYYNSSIVNQKNLTIPHPELHKRNFTLVPLCEIAAEYIHPILKQTNETILKNSPDGSIVTKTTISL